MALPLMIDVDDDGLGVDDPPWPKERTDLKCPEPGCTGMLQLRPSKYGMFYGCSNYPNCRGSHGAHPDGAPLGIPADKKTCAERRRAHDYLDRLWRPESPFKIFSRFDAYFWMFTVMKLNDFNDAHIAKFNREQCLELIGHLKREYPQIIDIADQLDDADRMFDEP